MFLTFLRFCDPCNTFMHDFNGIMHVKGCGVDFDYFSRIQFEFFARSGGKSFKRQ